jgi:hypothetical protein
MSSGDFVVSMKAVSNVHHETSERLIRFGANKREVDELLIDTPQPITGLSAVSIEPEAADFADNVDISKVAPRDGLFLGSQQGLHFIQLDEAFMAPGVPGSTRIYPPTSIAITLTGEILPPPTAPKFVDFADSQHGPLYYLAEHDTSTVFVTAPEEDGSYGVPVDALAEVHLESGEPLNLERAARLAVSRLGGLAIVDRSGKRIVVVTERRTAYVAYHASDGLVNDVEFDEMGNLYFTSKDGVTRMDRAGAAHTLARSSTPSSSEGAETGADLDNPTELAISPNGDLLFVHDDGRRVSKIEKVSSVEGSLSGAGGIWQQIAGAPVEITVPKYCVCVGGAPSGFAFVKAKIALDASERRDPVRLIPENLRLVVLYEGEPNLVIRVPDVPPEGSEEFHEGWSGRSLAITSNTRIVRPERVRAVSINGREYTAYAIPANALNIVDGNPRGIGVGFASELTGSEVAPGSTYYDSRVGYGSLIFHVPLTSAGSMAISPIPVGIAYKHGDEWLGYSEVSDWGATGAPWSF